MRLGRFHVTRRRALTLLLFLLLVAPIPLMDLAQMSDLHRADPPSGGPNWFWLVAVFVVMGSAVRGNRSALALWAVLSGVIGTAMVVWDLFAQNGSVRFLGGFLGIAASIVFLLVRDEISAGSADSFDENEVARSR